MCTLFGCGKLSLLAVKRNSSAVSSMCVCTKQSTGHVRHDDERARAVNVAIKIVNCVYLSILRLNT